MRGVYVVHPGADPDGGFARSKCEENFDHHAHFTCRFRVCELRARKT